MYPARHNTRLLFDACQANGIVLPDNASENYMRDRILGVRQTKTDSSPPKIDLPPPKKARTLNKTTFVEQEARRIEASYYDNFHEEAQIIAEAESRYDEIKKQMTRDDDLLIESPTPDDEEQLKSAGWVAVIIEPSGTYFRKSETPVKSTVPQETISSIIDAQDEAYAIAQVCDMEKEAQKAAALSASTQGLVASGDLGQSLHTVAPEMKSSADSEAPDIEEYVCAARRRLMDWLVINNKPVEMGSILGLDDAENCKVINPRMLASKFAHAIFPEESTLSGLSFKEMKMASMPMLMWSKEELDAIDPAQSEVSQATE